MNTKQTRPRTQVSRTFSFLVSYANSIDEVHDAYGCEDFPTFKEAENFIRENFFNNPHMQEKGIYIISTYHKPTDICISDICKCYWKNSMLHEIL